MANNTILLLTACLLASSFAQGPPPGPTGAPEPTTTTLPSAPSGAPSAPSGAPSTLSPVGLPSSAPTPGPTVPGTTLPSAPSGAPSAPSGAPSTLSPVVLPSKAPTPGPTVPDFSDRPSMMPSQIPPSTMPSTVADLPECVCQHSYDWTSFGVVCDTHCMDSVNGAAYCYVEHGGNTDPCGVENQCSGGVRCRVPGFSPSVFPTTSAPTIEAETASPSTLPSKAPTPDSTVADLPECVCQDGYDWSSYDVVCDTHCMNDGAAYCHPNSAGVTDPCGGETCGANEIRCRMPVFSPSELPTSSAPTMEAETVSPAVLPSKVPTSRPSVSGSSILPTSSPTSASNSPSYASTFNPSQDPSAQPSTYPSAAPSALPSSNPSLAPITTIPSAAPSNMPSSEMTTIPSASPSNMPSSDPSLAPITTIPSAAPSNIPSSDPSLAPITTIPFAAPSNMPSSDPSLAPISTIPSQSPSDRPSLNPSLAPIVSGPTSRPSAPTQVLSLESISLVATVAGVTDANKDDVCEAFAGSLNAYVTYCELLPQSAGRRMLQTATLEMELEVADKQEAEALIAAHDFLQTVDFPEGVAAKEVHPRVGGRPSLTGNESAKSAASKSQTGVFLIITLCAIVVGLLVFIIGYVKKTRTWASTPTEKDLEFGDPAVWRWPSTTRKSPKWKLAE